MKGLKSASSKLRMDAVYKSTSRVLVNSYDRGRVAVPRGFGFARVCVAHLRCAASVFLLRASVSPPGV